MNSKGMSIAGLALGVFAVCGFFFCKNPNAWWMVFVCLAAGIVGIVLSTKGSAAAKANNEPKGLAVAGLVCSIVGTALAGLATIFAFACVACVACYANEAANELNNLYNSLY